MGSKREPKKVVLEQRLRLRISDVADPQGANAMELLSMLHSQSEAARLGLLSAIRSDRYLELIDRLIAAAGAPKLPDDGLSTRKDAARTFSGLVRRSWVRLRSAANGVSSDLTDDDLHQLRIVAKRCRYGAQAASLVCGRDARRFAGAVKELQTVLGDHQDTVVAETWIRSASATQETVGFLAGLLIGIEIVERSRLRSAVEDVWARVDQPALRGWLD